MASTEPCHPPCSLSSQTGLLPHTVFIPCRHGCSRFLVGPNSLHCVYSTRHGCSISGWSQFLATFKRRISEVTTASWVSWSQVDPQCSSALFSVTQSRLSSSHVEHYFGWFSSNPATSTLKGLSSWILRYFLQ